MNPKLKVDQSVFLILYAYYKAYIIPFCTILVCIILFFLVVLPQVQSYFANRDTVVADEQVIQVLNQNLTTIGLLKKETVAHNITLVTTALPSEKDFTGILNAISQAASIANVGLGDYSFQIGDVFGGSQKSNTGQLSLQIVLSLTGDLSAAKRFIDALAKEFPLSEVTSVNARGDGGSQISANFFYNPSQAVQFNPSYPISQLSLPQQKLLKSLGTDFSKPQDTALPSRTVATSSASTQ